MNLQAKPRSERQSAPSSSSIQSPVSEANKQCKSSECASEGAGRVGPSSIHLYPPLSYLINLQDQVRSSRSRDPDAQTARSDTSSAEQPAAQSTLLLSVRGPKLDTTCPPTWRRARPGPLLGDVVCRPRPLGPPRKRAAAVAHHALEALLQWAGHTGQGGVRDQNTK